MAAAAVNTCKVNGERIERLSLGNFGGAVLHGEAAAKLEMHPYGWCIS